ncbi:MAG TPA: transglycosylase domain-containing protein [Candidatus Limnocylindria bacterium]|nr:transglycosylase domain-containing protein [Candidatus Limnocylindria bacterium]
MSVTELFTLTAPRLALSRRRGRTVRRAIGLGGLALLLGLTWWELATSTLQASILSAVASRMRYTMAPGPSREIVFPQRGPFDVRRGYTQIPKITERLMASGYWVVEQSRFSQPLLGITSLGVTPPANEPAQAGLTLRGESGDTIYHAVSAEDVYQSFEDIPPLIVPALLYMENRRLDRPTARAANPAIDWGRLAKAGALYAGRQLGLPVRIEGASTLAVQMEKYRHSRDGLTSSPLEKLRQMVGASLAAYRNGTDTRDQRRRVILDYLNSLPLGAVPGRGEVYGLKAGLRAWFDLDPEAVSETLREPEARAARAEAFKHVLALLYAVRAPSRYLSVEREELARRLDYPTSQLAHAGMIDSSFADRVREAPLRFAARDESTPEVELARRKAANYFRAELQGLLGARDLYALDGWHLDVETTLDESLQRHVTGLFEQLGDTAFVRARGLVGPRLLGSGDPGDVIYSLLLYERTPRGNLLRVQADNLDRPLDVNFGMKLELGSTAKLRTLAHYLELVALLHEELSMLEPDDLARRARTAHDSLTAWAAATLRAQPDLRLSALLDRALERTYRASPGTTFFTGGGVHHFQNFDPKENGRTLSVRDATVSSTNLVFVRLMRDLVRYHTARLDYDAQAILAERAHPERRRMLEEIAEQESQVMLRRAVGSVREGKRAARRMRRDPLAIWSADYLGSHPSATWPELLAASENVRRETSSWLFRTRNVRAQQLRLRTRIERDAFERMTPYWRRLGFPFATLVPSYASAIGSAADRPAALAELMGIIVNDGVRWSPATLQRVHFANGTPYQTTLAPPAQTRDRVLPPQVASALRSVLADVVDRGTARRVRGRFAAGGDTLVIGGKTGSGDNRFETFARGGRPLASRPVSRTATFAFYLEDRYYGVITATILGTSAGDYRFTSSLPLAVLELLAPELSRKAASSPATPKDAAVARPPAPT